MKELKIKLLRPEAHLPQRGTPESAGLDLCAVIPQPMPVEQGQVTRIPTGIAIQLEPGYVALVFGRSGLGVNHGVVPANAVGVVDSDYRGELMVCLTCQRSQPYTVQPGERVAQLVVLPIAMPEPVEASELEESFRGTGGFGSTGK